VHANDIERVVGRLVLVYCLVFVQAVDAWASGVSRGLYYTQTADAWRLPTYIARQGCLT
jgi:hypothetical protein